MALSRQKLAKFLRRARTITGGRFPYKAIQKLKKEKKYPKMSGRSKSSGTHWSDRYRNQIANMP